jgi:NADH-quinone oxidoreductase subunit L
MIGRFFSVYVNKNIIYGLTLISSFLGFLFSLCGVLLIPLETILETQVPFIKINDFILSCGILVDKTALIFATVLFGISFVVQLFSINYMKKEKKVYRFYALLNLFNFAMAGFFFSPNMFETYVFWELVGVVSYLLIGFEYFKSKKSLASKKVFIINRIGDTALISGIIICSYFMYTYSSNLSFTTLSFVDMPAISTFIYAYTSNPLYIFISGLFIIAAIVKSAQFPFYTWLIDAMEAKLPVSALLHSATMVISGIFILVRLLPFLTLEPMLLKVLVVIGFLSAILCSISACAQNNPKKVLAYSTSAQLGLMFVSLGFLSIKVLFALFISHAIIKSMLFLTLPNENEQFGKINFILFLLGGLSLSGLMFSGLITKEVLYGTLKEPYSQILCVISFLTAFYIMRIGLKINFEDDKKSNFISALILLIMNIVFYFYIRTQFKYEISIPFWTSLTAWVCTYILYIKNSFRKVPIIYSLALEGFYLDKFYSNNIVQVYNWISNKLNNIETKIFSNYNLIIYLANLGVKVSNYIETKIMDGSVSLITKSAKMISLIDLKAQDGNIQKYNAYAYIIITTIITCLIIGYTTAIIYIKAGGG